MIHPWTTLRLVDGVLGYGVFATRVIPRGTITWVGDPLDASFQRSELAALPRALRHRVEHLGHLDNDERFHLSWDFARYLNHSCAANCREPGGLGLEIATRDIAPGEQLTVNYCTAGMTRSFHCQCASPRCSGIVGPDLLLSRHTEWDDEAKDAFASLLRVEQPLRALVDHPSLEVLAAEPARLPSCREFSVANLADPRRGEVVSERLWRISDD